jgi:hypothetical protein
MKEMTARLSIMAIEELTAAQKLIMLYILTRVDWTTWSGQVSTNDIELGTAQSGRNIKRSLKALTELGYIERHITKRDSGLHHKAQITVNVSKLGAKKSPQVVTESHHTNYVIGDRKSPPIVTESHHTPDNGSDRKSPPVVTSCPPSSDRKSPGVVTSCPSSGDRKSPNINIDQYKINIEQSKINSSEPEPEPRMKRGILEDGYEWCERCKQNVSMDEPHTYPHSKLICSDDQPTPEEVSKAMEWDRAWGAPEVKVSSEVKRGDFFYLGEIHDELNYKREVFDILNDYGRHDVRLCLWNRQDGDKLFREMMDAKIAPRSVIDWVTVYYGGEATGDTPSKPKPPTSFKVTVEQQQKILEADRAWLTNGQTNNGDSNIW